MSEDIIEKFARNLLTSERITVDQLELFENAIAAHHPISEKEQELVDHVATRFRRQQEIEAAPAARAYRKIAQDGVITREELSELHNRIMADGEISSDEQMIIQSIVNKIRMHELREE